MTAMAARIEIVTAERIRDELTKLVCGAAPAPRADGCWCDTGLADQVLPELPALALEIDEHHQHKDVYEHTLTVLEQAIDLEDRLGGGPDFVLRMAALMHDVGKPRDPALRRGRPGQLPPPRGGRRADDQEADEGAAVPQGRDRRGHPAWSSCTCASTGTAAASGPTRRCAATSATPGTCWTGCTS